MKLDKIIAVRTGKTVYKDGDRVIKVFENGYSKADILNEALNQARIEETGLNIPKILGVSTENGKWAIISEYIKGKTLAQLMTENPDKFDEYLERFVDIQMEIHSKKAPLLTKLKDKMNRKINQADIDATTRYDLHTRLEGMPRHNKVCHGDFNPSNIIKLFLGNNSRRLKPFGQLLICQHRVGNARVVVGFVLFCNARTYKYRFGA